jgi:anaerobic magnesium-protoporphyrin IX monomethyl ester cyclase
MARVAFLQLNFYELHGLEALSAVLKARGHEVRLFIPGNERRALQTVADWRPDVVGLGLTTVERQEGLLWARAIKDRTGARVALGGIDPTFFPEVALDPSVDAVCRGEAETTLADLCDRIGRGEDFHDLPGLAFARNGQLVTNPIAPVLCDLDSLPFPDKSLYFERYSYFRDYPIKFFMASRGCPHGCSYCANRGLRALYPNPGDYIRFKSPGYLVEEIKQAFKIAPARVIGFNDDLFTHRLAWLSEFLPRLKAEVGVPFFCNARIDTMTEEKAAALAANGCYTCWYGLESADPVLREQMLGRRMSNDDIHRGVEILHRHGILAQSYNILNLPGEGFDAALRTLEFNRELKNDFVVASLFQPFPGTELFNKLLAEGRIEERPRASRRTVSYFAFSPVRQPDTPKVSNLQKFFIVGQRFPGLMPLIKRLCALPPNPLFDILFLVSFAMQYGRTHRLNAREVVKYNLKHLFTTYIARGRSVPRD